ncbi:hypothetical protein ACFFGR_05445 [Arthrobacter liuii]|nr:hypothetical protein [Arthrobacter liuii]
MNTEELLAPSPAKKKAVHSTADLACGDLIEAAYRGAVIRRGTVTRITSGDELFWITDDLSGTRRLLDVTEFDITRL